MCVCDTMSVSSCLCKRSELYEIGRHKLLLLLFLLWHNINVTFTVLSLVISAVTRILELNQFFSGLSYELTGAFDWGHEHIITTNTRVDT